MPKFDPYARRPMLTDEQVDELLNRVCTTEPNRGSKTRLSLMLPRNGSWRVGAFGSIDASPALMATFGTRTLYHVVGNEQADRHYYLELIERVDGAHDLYLKYHHILGSRLLGGVSDAQLDVLRARFEGRMPLPDLKLGPTVAHMRVVREDNLAARGKEIETVMAQVREALPPAQPSPLSPATKPEAARASDVQGTASATSRSLSATALPDAAASRSRRIDPDVLEVLRAGRTEDRRFYLGPERLDPKLYKRVNTVLKDLGGAWKGGKTQAHVFEGAADEAVAAVIASGEYLTAKDFGFFPTPAGLAERAVAMAGLQPGMKVLEPSAGDGSLALRAAAIVGKENLTAVEFLDRNVTKLKAAGLSDVIHGDFLAVEPAPIYQAVIMNPPFGNLQDVRHIEHAARFLRPDGVLIAIMSPSYQHRNTAAAAAFREFTEASEAEAADIPAGTFRESGTEVATVLLRMEASNFPWHRDLVQLEEVDAEESAEAADAPRG